MRILNSVLKEDVEKILNDDAASTGSFLLDVVLQTKAGLDIPIERVHELLLDRDYMNAPGDRVMIVVESTRASYEHLVFPNRADLKASVTVTPCDKNGNHPGDPFTVIYRAKLTDPTDNTFKVATMGGDKLVDKQGDNYYFALQLIEQDLDDLLDVRFSAVVYGHTVQDTIECICSNFGGLPISLHPPDNTDTHDHIVLEQDHKLFYHANWMQNEGRGVYNHGCSTYLMNGWVFVFPPLLVEPHPERKRHVVYRCGPDEMIGVEQTFRVEGEVAYILATGEAEYSDNTETLERENGNIIIYDSEPDYTDDRVSHADGVTTFENGTWTTIADKDRLVNTSKTYNRQTSNPYREESRLREVNGKFIELVWTNANPQFFPPNTEIEVHYVNADELYTLSGVVVGYYQEAKATPIRGNLSVFHPVANLRVRLE